jgi:hypothetical protein
MPAGGKCSHLRPDGGRCRAYAVHNSQYCYVHDPACAAHRQAARKAGGVARSRRAAVLPADTPDKALSSAKDVSRLLADTINQTLRGEIDPRIANTVGYLATNLVKTIDRTDVEARLARLEQVVASQTGSADAKPFDIVRWRKDEEEMSDENNGVAGDDEPRKTRNTE